MTRADVGVVRTHADGTAELRTTERGGLRRYVIDLAGRPTLLESEPEPQSFRRSQWICGTGLALAFGVAIPVLVAGGPEWLGGLIAILGIGTYFVGVATSPYAAEPAGERWTRIGGPDD